MAFPAVIHGGFGQQFAETTTQKLQLGVRMFLPDGRKYVYVEMGGTIGVSGNLYQSEAKTTAWCNENATVVAAQYATSVTVDVATTPTADDFKDGFLLDETNGHIYSIAASTAADPVVLTLNERLETDIALADTLSMFKSPFKDVIVKVAAEASAPVVGVSTQIIAADSFGWLQTYGLCGTLIESTAVIGDHVVASPGSNAGAVSPTGSSDLDQIVGYVLEIGATGEIGTIFLTLD